MGWRSDLLQRLPPRVSLPVRSRLGFSREPEMQVLPQFVRTGDHCVDVGCHLGIYAFTLLRLVGPPGSVVGFEPQDALANYLDKAFRPWIKRGRFRVERAALGPVRSEAVLSLPFDGARINRGRASLRALPGRTDMVTVPVLALDQATLNRPVSFIKCDVEGYELQVLQGAQTILREDSPVLLVEIESQHAGERVMDTFVLLWDLGYTAAVYRQGDGVVATIPKRDLDPVASAAQWCGHYVYNFLFVPETRRSTLAGCVDVHDRK